MRTGAGAGAADCVAVLAELLVERAARLTGGAYVVVVVVVTVVWLAPDEDALLPCPLNCTGADPVL